LVFDILREGKNLIVKDDNIFIKLMERVSYEAIDFREFIKDFYAIKQRSCFLSQKDPLIY